MIGSGEEIVFVRTEAGLNFWAFINGFLVVVQHPE
jgi:hypothetical protein